MLSLEDITKSSREKCISLPGLISTKSIEPAGFVFFLRHEWHLSFNPYTGDVKVLSDDLFETCKNIALNYINLFNVSLSDNVKNKDLLLDKCYSYRLKYQISQSFLSYFSIESNREKSQKNEVNDDLNNFQSSRKKGSNCKITSLVKKFSQNNENIYTLLPVNKDDPFPQIRKTYLKIAMLLHPDKSANLSNSARENTESEDKLISDYRERFNITSMSEEEKTELFLRVQDAYTILSDESLRFDYECMMPFDESIPTIVQANNATDYYSFMSYYFDLNSKWSKTQPVPKFGDFNTNPDDVDYFYSFWRNFDSKRIFCAHFSHMVDEAENREERRWMERENARIQRKMLKADMIRIQKLVDIAQSTDPRIKLRQQMKNQIKLQKREEKLQKQREEAERLLNAEKLRLEAIQKESQELKIKKQMIKKWKYHIKTVLTNAGIECGEEFNTIFSSAAGALLKNLMMNLLLILKLDTVYNIYYSDNILDYPNAVKLFESTIHSCSFNDVVKQKVRLEWDEFRKTTGTTCSDTSTSSTTESQYISTDQNSAVDTNEWTSDEISILTKAIKTYPVGTISRWELIANCLPRRSAKEVISKANEISSGLKAFTADKTETVTENETKKSPAPSGPAVNGTAQSGVVWTKDEQVAFEKALMDFPASTTDPKLRWYQIAKCIPGKTPQDCLNRFKQIRELILAQSKINRTNS